MMKRSVIAMLVVCATVVGNAADFSEGKFAQGQYNDPSDGSMWFRELGDSEWDGTRLYDEYMDVGGVKYPVVNESQVLLLPISVTPGEKVTPVIASGTAPASAVTLKCLSDAEVLAKFRKFKDGDVQNYWIQDQWPRNAARSYRAWIYVGLKNGQSKLRATCDVSSRLAPQMAPGVQSGDTLTQYAARFGINFCGALMSSPSLWIEVGLRESGKVWPSRIYCDCRGSCMSPRELARWLSLEEAVADAASEMFSDEDRGESAGEALVCAAAWYIAPLDAGAYEVVLRSSDLMKGQVTGGGLFRPGEKASLMAVASKGSLFAGWFTNPECTVPIAGSVDYRTSSYTYVATGEDDVTLYAKFISVTEDFASIGCEVEDEYATNAAIEPIPLVVKSGSLPTVKVAGTLPTGLKFTAKALDVKATKTTPAAHYEANTIYGTPTKSGVYTVTITVTTAGKATATKTVTFTVIDRDKGENFLKTEYDSTMGKVTGAGIYAAGKKVTLKATANKGYVFAGWYEDDGFWNPLDGAVDYRTTTFTCEMPDEDTTVYARFVPAAEDGDILLYVGGEEVGGDAKNIIFNASEDLPMMIETESMSIPKVVISNLPAGLKYTATDVYDKKTGDLVAEANTIYGTATKPGTYIVTAKLTNTTVKKAIEKKFTIVVDNLTAANDLLYVTDAEGNLDNLLNAPGEKYVISVGVTETGLPNILASAASDKVSVTGLPTGLKYDTKTGKITGVATKAGTYTAQIKVTSGKSSHLSTFTVEVEPLPDWVVGTFVGMGFQKLDSDHGGRELASDSGVLLTLTVSSNGKCTCKATTDYESCSLKGLFLARESDGGFCVAGEGAIVPWDHDLEYNRCEFRLSHVTLSGAEIGKADLTGYNISVKQYGVWRDTEWKDAVSMQTDERFPLWQSVWGMKDLELPVKVDGKEVVLDTPDGRGLVLKFSRKGVVTAALWEKKATRASVTASGQLSLCDYDQKTGVWNGQVCLILMDRNPEEVGAIVSVKIDSNGNPDCSIEHYEYNWR